MTGRASALRFRRFRLIAPGGQISEPILGLILLAAIGMGAVAGGSATASRLAVGLAGGLLFFLISMSGRVTSLRLVITWLVFIGLVRRMLIPIAGWSEQDPLLLIGPGCAVMIWLSGRKTAPMKRDALAYFAFLFLVWAVAQVLNPLSDSVLDDVKGLLFWVPPLIWLFVGRTFTGDIHRKVSNLIIWLAVPVSLHGLWQSFGHFFPFELHWVGVSGFGAAIFFEGFKIRPFASLTSPQEYGAFMAVALAFLWGTILERRPRMFLRLGALGLFSSALFLQGTRHTFGLFVLMLVITTIMWHKNFAVRVIIVTAFIGMVAIIQMKMLPTEWGDGALSTAIEHQIQGFQDPGNSTAPLHEQMIINGFVESWEHPLGVGLAHTTIAAAKAGKLGGGTEYDMSNVFVTFGIPFGALYAIFLILVFGTSIHRFYQYRSAYTIGVFSIFLVVFGNIWNGGLYTVSAILWFAMGGMIRPIEELASENVDPEIAPDPDKAISLGEAA